MKKQTKVIIAIVLLMAMFPLMLVPASANSALTKWGGKDANGVMMTSDCPIIVEHETLTFNINELPEPDPLANTDGLDSSVTAEYTFYNPSDTEITAKLAFPFGVVKSTDYNSADEKYSITVNGQKISEKTKAIVSFLPERTYLDSSQTVSEVFNFFEDFS